MSTRFVLVLSAILLCSGCGYDSDDSYLYNHMIGEMQIDPDWVFASGSLEAEVQVWVYLTDGDHQEPLSDIDIEIVSLRNHGGVIVDIIEQPNLPTDENGRAVGFIGSSDCYDAQITAKANGATLCERWDENQCVLLLKTVDFYIECGGSWLENCDCECADLMTDPENCGACDYRCDFDHARVSCVDGVCEMGDCRSFWGDCNDDTSDGCETDLYNDSDNCGRCLNACHPSSRCAGGVCVDW